MKSKLQICLVLLDLPKLIESVQQLNETASAAKSQMEANFKSEPISIPRTPADVHAAIQKTPKRASDSLMPQSRSTNSTKKTPPIRASTSGAVPKTVFDYEVGDDGQVSFDHNIKSNLFSEFNCFCKLCTLRQLKDQCPKACSANFFSDILRGGIISQFFFPNFLEKCHNIIFWFYYFSLYPLHVISYGSRSWLANP